MKKDKEQKEEEHRPPIPQPIQRAVRRRCCYGCVFCGLPLYEYHHMTPYSEVQRHDEDNLTLLCPNHHQEATNRLLTTEQVITANSSPFNSDYGISSPYALHFSGTEFQVEIGTNILSGGTPLPDGGVRFIPISVNDTDILWFWIDKNGQIFFNMHIRDEHNVLLLVIEENVLTFKTDTWDIEFKGKKLTLRQATRDIFLEIEFCPPNGIRIIRGRLLCDEIEILVRKSHIFILNHGQIYSDCEYRGGEIGLHIGRNDRGYRCCLHSSPIQEVVNNFNSREEALEYERKSVKKTKELMSQLGRK